VLEGDGEQQLPGLDCNELVELVTEYFDGTLDATTRARLEHHLAECPYCRTYLEQMRLTIAAAGSLEPEAVPADVLDRLTNAYREAHRV
jgi:anti-sigma factor RsiW